MKNTVGYVRVSTSGQALDGFSLEMQESKIRAYCQFNDLNLSEVIVDAGISGKNLTGRPGAQRLMSMIESKKIGAIVVYKLDRLGRSTTDLLDIAKLIEKKGVTLHSITEKLDTSTALGLFFFTLTGAMAEMERGLISERTIAGMAQKRQEGGRVSRFARFGYRFNSKGNLEIDETEQAAISRIKYLHSKSYSLKAIEQRLEAEGFRSRNNTIIGRTQIWRTLKAA
ncbi:MAG: recombinase family protein [Desulfomonilaceae bacterium]